MPSPTFIPAAPLHPKPPHPSPSPRTSRKRPRCSLPPRPISRRAFSALAATLLLSPLAARAAPLLDDDLDVDAAPSEATERGLELTRPLEERYGIMPDGRTAATYDDYLRAIHVGRPTDLSHTASIYLARLGVVAYVAAYCAIAQSISERQSLRTKLPTKYDPDVLARYFSIRPDKLVRRFSLFAREFVDVAFLFSANLLQDLLQRQSLRRGVVSEQTAGRNTLERQNRLAKKLRTSITKLGPAVIKLGQAAATRPDIFPAPIVRELQTLQDNVLSMFPTAQAYALIESELGARPNVLFDNMSKQPVAGASLGMVFKAQIDGLPVAVKVQKPEVAEQIALDCYIVRWLASLATVVLRSRTDLRYAVDEYASRLFEELDYTNELDNMHKFRKLYANMPGIYLPKAFPEYSSRRVLVSEWVDGYKLIDEQARVRAEDVPLVETGIRFALTQLLDKGFLHADMHNGNMLRTKSGYLAYIDFGLVSEVPASVRESIVCALMHLIHGEYTLLAESFAGVAIMGVYDVEIDLPLLSEALRDAFEPDPDMLPENRERGVTRFGQFTLVGIVEKLLHLGSQFPFIFNDYFLNNLRCLAMLEGLALNADPNFSMLSIVYPYVVKKIITDPRPRYRQALDSLIIDSYGRIRWSRMDQLLHDVQTSSESSNSKFDVIPRALTKRVASKQRSSSDKSSVSSSNVTSSSQPSNTADSQSPVLVMRFITSNAGRFLRSYIIQQYLFSMELRWRKAIGAWMGDEAEVMADNSQAVGVANLAPSARVASLRRIARTSTTKEVSDAEALIRTRDFFRTTPLTQRCRVLLRLAPNIVLPLFRTLVAMLMFAMHKVAQKMFTTGAKERVVAVGRAEKKVSSGVESTQEAVSRDGVERWSIADLDATGDNVERQWTAFDSSFLRRTRKHQLDKATNEALES